MSLMEKIMATCALTLFSDIVIAFIYSEIYFPYRVPKLLEKIFYVLFFVPIGTFIICLFTMIWR